MRVRRGRTLPCYLGAGAVCESSDDELEELLGEAPLLAACASFVYSIFDR